MDQEQYNTLTAEQIIKDLHLEDMAEAERNEVLAAVQDRMHTVVINTLVRLSTPEQKEKLMKALSESGKADQVVAEVSAEIPEFATVLEEALQAEYEHFVELMAKK